MRKTGLHENPFSLPGQKRAWKSEKIMYFLPPDPLHIINNERDTTGKEKRKSMSCKLFIHNELEFREGLFDKGRKGGIL